MSSSTVVRLASAGLTLAVAGLAVLASGCGEKGPSGPPPAPPAKVTVQTPVKQSLADFREYTGRVEAVETEEVRARVKGFLEKIHFREGSEIAQDAPLYDIETAPFEADLAKAEAEVSRLEAQLALATGEAERAARLRGNRAVSEEEYQQRVAARNAAEAALRASRAALRTARLELGYTQIKAKIEGRIGRTLVTKGNLVGFNQPTLLTTIVKLDPVYVTFEDTEHGLKVYDEIVRAKGVRTVAEAKVPVKAEPAWERGFPHRGFLDFRDNKLEPGTGTIQLRATLPNKDRRLTPGQFVRVRVETSEPRPRLLVPEQAVSQDQGGKYLLLARPDNTVEKRPVTTGVATPDGLVSIETGLTENERVIVNGLQRARPGGPVEIVAAKK